MKNYYKILNLDFKASLAEVKTAYRKLALLYHPDKTDNELLKAKFAEIKEAYETLSHPARRKNYDLTFDDFSYKKEIHLTPYQLLQKVKELKIKNSKLDPHRMDLDGLEFGITELLSEKNTDTLLKSEDKLVVQQFITEILETGRPLSSRQFKPINDRLSPLADEETKEKMKTFLNTHSWDNRWHTYKILFALLGGILLCLFIYFIVK